MDQPADVPPPLTALTEDERLFRRSVLEFAERDLRPLVRDMDEHARIPRELLDKLFGLGVMGIEIPEELGGAGARPPGSGSAAMASWACAGIEFV